jgi:probable rRNA maturation factor
MPSRRASELPPTSAHLRMSASMVLKMILNRQRSIRISIRDLEKFTERARASLRLPADAFTICLVTKNEIARWNLTYRGKKGATDVLSFRNEETPEKPKGAKGGKTKASPRKKNNVSAAWPGREETGYLGDIAIAPEVARGNARQLGRTLEDEMRILVLHGMLHLMGYDHETDTGQMDRREQRFRRALGLA